VKQHDPEKLLELSDRPAQGWLRQREANRRSGEAALLCDRDETTQMAKLNTRRGAVMWVISLSFALGSPVMHPTHNGSQIGISVCALGAVACHRY
jgi:hypothetical protein